MGIAQSTGGIKPDGSAPNAFFAGEYKGEFEGDVEI